MRKCIITYLFIMVLMTGCSVQSSINQVESSLTYMGNSTSPKSTSQNINKTQKTDIITTNATSKPNKGEPTGNYKKIEVDGGDIRGTRRPMVVVDIGYGSREYWAYTNKYGQLIRVTAKKIILQNAEKEPILASGRYYKEEAKVEGTERTDLDQGHVIADSLGGVSNAYNITPQDSTLNRHGDQAYMEKNIRDAGGCTDFEAIITYPDTKTQIPSHYHYTYTIKGNVIVEDFDNKNPDEINKSLNKEKDTTPKDTVRPSISDKNPKDLETVDKNHNGKVTIAEAKEAGYKMPITKGHWLYGYMEDRDGDGMVGK